MIFIVLFFFGFYHWYLVIKGRTTNEEVRGKYIQWKGNPFDQGLKKNCSSNFMKYTSVVVDENVPIDIAIKNYNVMSREAEKNVFDMPDLDVD